MSRVHEQDEKGVVNLTTCGIIDAISRMVPVMGKQATINRCSSTAPPVRCDVAVTSASFLIAPTVNTGAITG